MNKNIPVYEIKKPDNYNITEQRDLSDDEWREVSNQIDQVIRDNYINNVNDDSSMQKILIRGISSANKTEGGSKMSIDDVVSNVVSSGHDRFGDAPSYAKNFANRVYDSTGEQADLFAEDLDLTKAETQADLTLNLLKTFYEFSVKKGKEPRKVDVIMLYDESKLKQLSYKSHGEDKHDAYKFLTPEQKQDALIGVIKLV